VIRPTITTSVADLGADVLQIGSDGDLSRIPGAIVRYRSQSFDGITHLDFHALALGAFQAEAIANELQEPGSSGLDADERSELIARLYALAAHERDARTACAAPARAPEPVTLDDLSDPDIVGAASTGRSTSCSRTPPATPATPTSDVPWHWACWGRRCPTPASSSRALPTSARPTRPPRLI